MKEKISALMDGEMFEDEAVSVLDQMKRSETAHQDWAIYHLIGDSLRQPDFIHRDVSSQVREQMQHEPTLLTPRNVLTRKNARALVFAAAASLAAVGVVAWMAMQIAPETVPRLALHNNALQSANVAIQTNSDGYLAAHQEFSPSADMSGSATYMRTLAYRTEEK